MGAPSSFPPVTPVGHLWRTAAVLALSAMAWATLAGWQWSHVRWWFYTDLGIGAATLALTFLRRRYPVSVAAVAAAANAVSATAGGPATLALMSLSTRRRWAEIVPVAALAVASGTVIERFGPASAADWRGTLAIVTAVVGVTVGWGMYIGSRRELLATLRDRAERAEAEQELRAERARAAERTRIAREMHDVLAHRISLLTLHAGALSYRTDLDPDQVRRSAALIQQTAQSALTELRDVLGVLREPDGSTAPESPQPDVADLPALIAEARAAGVRIVYTDHRAEAVLPVGTGRTVYRIVQEGLTNARKHAADTRVSVELGGAPGRGLELTIANPLRVGAEPPHSRPGSGFGLVGAAERVALAGGALSHRITPDDRFEVRAWLPWPT